ncbi:MAG: DUF120 domain-containing protein [Halobacteria archaeon]
MRKPPVVELKALALLGAAQGAVKISSSALAESWRTSPQTAARRLQSLERHGLVKRTMVPGGQKVVLTPLGLDSLRKEFAEYKRLFGASAATVALCGQVVTGLGEGQYYVSREGYLHQFRSRLGFEPFPGTLNLRLDPDSEIQRHRLDEVPGIPIEGFKTEERTFGPARCFRASIAADKARKRVHPEAAVILPERTHYPQNMLELLAPVELRRALKLRDGDVVTVEVPL